MDLELELEKAASRAGLLRRGRLGTLLFRHENVNNTGMARKDRFSLLTVFTVSAVLTTASLTMAATEAPLADLLAEYPNPGRVTGDIGIHDPSMVKTPAGTYLVVSTGPNLQLKTSADRTAFRNAGAVY